MSTNYFDLIKKTYQSCQENKISHLSASLAYYTIFSLGPLLIICIALAGFAFGNAHAEKQILQQITDMLGSDSAGQIKSMINGARQPFSGLLATIVGIPVLLFGASGLFGQLQDGLNQIWGVKSKPGHGLYFLIKERFLSCSMVLGVAFLLVISLVASALISMVASSLENIFPLTAVFWEVINTSVAIMLFTFLFGLVFKILPNVIIGWSDVWRGALTTALLFILGKFALTLYLSKTNIGSSYGSAGSLIIILIWVYYTAHILFVGAEFTKAYTFSKKRVEPAKNTELTNQDQ